MEKSTVDLLLGFGQLLIAAAGFVLAYVIGVSSNRVVKAQYTRSLQDAWNTLNSMALSSDDNLRAAEGREEPASERQDLSAIRKKWFSYMMLNALEASYLGMRG